jgi:hypothetical protein
MVVIRFEVVVAEDRDGRQPEGCRLVRKKTRVFRQAVVGQVARDEQAIGGVGNPSEERLAHALRGSSAVQVSYRGAT